MSSMLKKVLLAAMLVASTSMAAQAAESLRIVSAANPSGTWYIGMGAVGKVYTTMNPGTDVSYHAARRRCHQPPARGFPRR